MVKLVPIIIVLIILIAIIVIIWRILRMRKYHTSIAEDNQEVGGEYPAISKGELDFNYAPKEEVEKGTKTPTTPQEIICPDCGSRQIKGAYENRFECMKCGKIFT